MKQVSVILLFGLLALLLTNCGPEKVAPEEPTDTDTVVVAPEPVKDTIPPTPPPPEIRRINESEFMVVYYDFDKYNLVSDAKNALENNARLMKENDKMIVKIEGHCDERGTVEYNLSLGEKRAASARDYLIELGVGAGNIQIVSYGKARPVDTRSTEEAWGKNRRAKFTIISQ